MSGPVPETSPSQVGEHEALELRRAGASWGAPPRASADHSAHDPELSRLERAGSRPGQRYVRVVRPRKSGFEPRGHGVLEVTSRGGAPTTGAFARLRHRARRALLGTPLASAAMTHERLSKVKALAVLSSDALSSVAYATEQILFVLVAAGAAAYAYALPIMIVILVLLGVVVLSYRQTIRAYPKGGGSYIVAKDNLGARSGLVAASALMTDYVLTVAVSVASGVDNVVSTFPSTTPYRVWLCVGIIVLIMLGNLRGLREAGSIFAAPTYIFIASMMLMIGTLVVRFLTGSLHSQPPQIGHGSEQLTIFLVLRAFASGCTALTGVEAISDGVPAFKPPEWHNARTTLTVMGSLLAVMFLGITVGAHQLGLEAHASTDPNYQTVISQLAGKAFGSSVFFYVAAAATTTILTLAANTSFSDFPRLLFFLARDDYAPHQFKRLGDRLAFSNGIIALGVLAIALVVAFQGSVDRLIPLYTVGVFLAFTLSQAGMVVRWWSRREAGWRRAMPMNFVGMCMTGAVFIITAASKFTEGAYVVCVIIPLLFMIFRSVHRHYNEIALHMATEIPTTPTALHPICIVPLADLNGVALQSLAMARTISDEVIAVHVSDDEQEIARMREKWELWGNHVPLVVLESPYRSLVRPLLSYIDAIDRQRDDDTVVVILPELVATRWWHQLLHNQTALRLKAQLLFRPGTVVVNVPYHLRHAHRVRRIRRARDADEDAL